MENKALDQLIEKALGENIRKDMYMVSRAFNTVITKYSFLFDGDLYKSQTMLINSCFPLSQPIIDKNEVGNEDEDETIHFDMKELLSHIPLSVKEDIYQRLLTQLATKVEVDDLRKPLP